MSVRLLAVLGSGSSAFRLLEDDGRIEIRGRNRMIRGNRAFDQLVTALVAGNPAAALGGLARELDQNPADIRKAARKLVEDLDQAGIDGSVWMLPVGDG